ncbi:M16 family metallopeptidase [Selenihalanaerobacter shriftii]|uniref:Zinc protease n=1 Tax=Selenihalanaerobacter shriftii TaxID=142842 RepID=A0A1T4Q9A7_9FIRM|nr:pitrilysin family protein [Selenihalanaerobacter shriftii]SKA00333.1 zinc protease [Selenihalanaerobacter shriftii]
MKKVIYILLISLIVLALTGCAGLAKKQDVKGKLFVPKVNYSYFKLNNGLQVYVFEDHQLPLAKFAVWYKVGSIDEPQGLSGISHLLEHTMFLGTESLPKDEVHELIKSTGGINNAGTYYDYTMYYEEIPSTKLELAMAIEADRMGNLKIDPQEFKREKEVVMQERRKRVENTTFNSALEKIQAKAFKESSLHHQIIGWMKDLKNINTNDVRRYYNQYYAPNNAVMVVSGDVDPQRVHKLAKKYYGDYQSKEIDRLNIKEPKQTKERFIKVKENTKLPIIGMIYKIPKGNHPDMIAIEALLDIWINNSTSRVKSELKKKKNMILRVGAFPVELRKPGFALIYTMPMKKEIIDQVKNAFDEELKKLINEGITDEELKIVKKAALKKTIFNQKKTSEIAHTVAKSVIRYNDPKLYQKKIKRLKNLTKDDIIVAAKEYFTKNNRTVGYIVPKK